MTQGDVPAAPTDVDRVPERDGLRQLYGRMVAHRDELAAILVGLDSRLTALAGLVSKSDARAAERHHQVQVTLRDLQGRFDGLAQQVGQASNYHDELRDEVDAIVASLPRWRQARIRRRLEGGRPAGRHSAGAASRQPRVDPDQTEEQPALTATQPEPTPWADPATQGPAAAHHQRWSSGAELPTEDRRTWSVPIAPRGHHSGG